MRGNGICKRALLLGWLLLPSSPAAGADDAEPETSDPALPRNEPPRREKPVSWSAPTARVLGLSLAYQAPLDLDKDVPLGGGIVYTHEYFVMPRTALGVHLGLRFFPDFPWHVTLGYGLSVKHYVGSFQPSPRFGLYFLYGLQLQMNLLEDRAGSAVGHDTRLSVGFDWMKQPIAPFVEAGYHLTQVRNFEEETIWWPFAELVAGIRF